MRLTLALVTLGLLAHGGLTHAQTREAGRGRVDGDRVDDCWERTHDGGSGFGGVTVSVRRGCRGAPIVVDAGGSFAEFLTAAPLPVDAARAPDLVDGVAKLLFPAAARRCAPGGEGEPCERIDGSFEWLLDAARWPAAPPVAPFTTLRAYRPTWQTGPPTLPPSQVITLAGASYRPVVQHLTVDETPTPAAPARGARHPFALLAYLAHNHGAITRAETCASWTLFKTAHGVIARTPDGGRWSWVFVSTGADKLRHPSIEAVTCDGAIVVAARKGPDGRELVVVAPELGRYGSLPLDDAWRLDAATHVLHVGAATYPVADLVRALAPPTDWRTRYDLDGDGRADTIETTFTGGAHCCYQLAVTPSTTGRRVKLPYDLDGGYAPGQDLLADPRRVAIADFDGDGKLELLLELAGDREPSHLVRIDFPRGRRRVRDLGVRPR